MRSSSLFSLSWSLVAAAALLACGGSQPAATTPAGETAASGENAADAPAAPAPEGELVWSDSMPTKDKGMFMKKKVMPAMTKVFQTHDAKEFADFSCKTCHGPSMKPKPAEFLPTLHFKGGKLVEADTMPAMAKFMHDSVTPTMADLFGKKPYDPATNEGFGCKGCHNIEM
jgi:hypothetical protein